MSILKKLPLLATGMAALTGTGYSDIKLADNLTLSGFVDMSYTSTSVDGGADSTSYALDQVEFDFKFDIDENLSIYTDVQIHPEMDGIEQGYLNYSFGNGVNFKAGKFLSYSGWETAEPTGLFQYSGTGYAGDFYGGYHDGISLNYSGEMVGLGLSIVNDVFQKGDAAAQDAEDLGFELMGALMPTENLTFKAFYMTEDIGGRTESKFNLWGSIALGGLTLAAEYNSADDVGDSMNRVYDATGYLLMANYAWDRWGVTLRYHDHEKEISAGNSEEMSAITFAPSFTVTENLLLVAEYRADDRNNAAGADSDTIALEALVTF